MNRRFESARLLVFAAIVLTGCASAIPEAIRQPAPGDVAIDEARADLARYRGQTVRWGGVILSTENRSGETWVTVLSRPLASHGEPRDTDITTGRFYAVIPGFLDPAVYEQGRRLTLRGRIVDGVTQPVGEHPYFYPVIRAEVHYLWPKAAPESQYYPPPYWYDPWYPFHRPYWPPPYRW